MTASLDSLFSLTSDELFEKYTISEIKLMQNNLQKEINKKKDELRVLVGEKYRDFIEVIDKIGVMNKLASNITGRIDDVSTSLSTLNSNVQNRTYPKLNDKFQRENHVKSTIAILIKLLIDIEDQIWCEILNCRFVIATTLLQLAVHIKTVLSLESSWKIDKKFPVVHELWISILRFPVVLTQLVEEKLKSPDISVTIACECLCSMTVLDNSDSVNIIKKFLTLRTETLKNALNLENDSQNVRTRILTSFQIIINTIEILYYCFRNSVDEKGDYWNQMENMIAPLCQPAINFVTLDYTTKYGRVLIPSVVQNFKIKTTKQTTPLSPSEYYKSITEWLLWVRTHATNQISSLLNLIGSLRTLHLLKESVPALLENWPTIMEHFNQKRNLNLWKELYEPLIVERAKALLLHQWHVAFDHIRSEIDSLIKEILENKRKEPEDNLHWFLWESLEDDILQPTTTDSNKQNIKGLSIKSLGLSPNSGKICTIVESLVSNIITELSNINTEKDLENKESLILKRHQQLCCLELVEKLVNHVVMLTDSHHESEGVTIFLARFLSGMAALCPSLKECILNLDDKGAKWLDINKMLQEENLNIWRRWSSTVSIRVFKEFSSLVALSSSPSFRMKYFPKWDTIKIKQETEDCKQVESELKIPFQASFLLQDFFNSLTLLIGQTLPPRIITIEMMDSIVNDLLCLLSDVDEGTTHQSIYVQFLFDVKYLSALLIPIENNELTVQSNNAVTKIESKIDPVDLDAITSYLSQNVKQFVFKTQGLYGLLINNKPRIIVDQYIDNSEEPNVTYSGGSNVPWFSLLPVSTSFPSTVKK